MTSASPIREGMRAAIPVCLAYITTSLTLGVAAKAHGLHWVEIVLMSAVVFAGPAQFAALEPLASGKPALAILLTTFLINLRFLVMSTALLPYFGRVRRRTLLLCTHLISISTFIIPYVYFQKKHLAPSESQDPEQRGRENLQYFFGMASTSFTVWVLGTGFGYWAALHVPQGFEEGLKFMLPGYFACLLTAELRRGTGLLIAILSFLVAAPGAMLSKDWGWLVAALLIASLAWGIEQWTRRA